MPKRIVEEKIEEYLHEELALESSEEDYGQEWLKFLEELEAMGTSPKSEGSQQIEPEEMAEILDETMERIGEDPRTARHSTH